VESHYTPVPDSPEIQKTTSPETVMA
jgi:hypothetical protein